MKIELFNEDNLKILATIADNSIDSIVTDPPYGISFMNNHWDYDVPTVELWRECLRVLKPGGHLLAFSSTRTYHRMANNIEDAGFEIRDMIEWIYSSGFPKNQNLKKAAAKRLGGDSEFVEKFDGIGTALKPSHEPICMARKPLQEKNTLDNMIKYGTGAIDIDSSRVPLHDIDENQIRTINRNQRDKKDGWGMTNNQSQESVSVISSEKGRHPANVIHDGSDVVVNSFPLSGTNKNKEKNAKPYIYKGKEYNNADTSIFNGDKPEAPSNYNDYGSAARYFYCAKPNKKEKTANGKVDNKHPTVKPVALMEYLVRMVTPSDGVVLDPFMGSGTTGIACKRLNKSFIGIELDAEYFAIAKTRIDSEVVLNREAIMKPCGTTTK